MSRAIRFKEMPLSYRQLIAMYAPRPIHTERELVAATAIVDAMAGHRLNADQEDYLELMSMVVSVYDQKHHPVKVKNLEPREAVAALLEEAGMTASDLGRLLGNRELGSKILRGERGLSMAHVAILSERFAVGPQLFMSKPSGAGRKANVGAARVWRGSRRSAVGKGE